MSENIIVPGMRLGCKPLTSAEKDHLPHLALHGIRAGIFFPKPPDARMWLPTVDWGMMTNDVFGTCLPAACGHAIQAWTGDATGTPVTVPDSAIMQMYEVAGHYVPGNPATDQGMSVVDALGYFRVNGLAGHTDRAWSYVATTNLNLVRTAINIFGICIVTMSLPKTAIAQVGGLFDVPPGGPVGDGAPGTWGEHGVAMGGFDPSTFFFVTWANIQKMTTAFFSTYVTGVFPVFDLEFLRKNGKTPGGLTQVQLRAFISAM